MIFQPKRHKGKYKEDLCELCAFVAPAFPVFRMESPMEYENDGR